MAISVFFCTALATALEQVCHFNQEHIKNGLFGFNAALIGAAMVFYFKLNVGLCLVMMIGVVVATFLQKYILTKKWSLFTLPFIVTTWVLVCVVNYFNISYRNFTNISLTPETNPFFSILKGYSQVVFQDQAWAGCMFLLAIFLANWQSAFLSIIAVTIISCIFWSWNNIHISLSNGLLTYNVILSSLVYSQLKIKEFFYCISACLAIFVLHVLFLQLIERYNLEIIMLTFPFVLVSSVVVLIRK
jgi:urea transporter